MIAVVVPLILVPQGVRWLQKQRDLAEQAARGTPPPPAIVFSTQPDGPITVEPDRWKEIGLRVEAMHPSPPARALQMDGVLYLNPDEYALVRSRFVGEIVDVPEITDSSLPNGKNQRPLRFGDRVRKGQVLATVWSRELGEKKSELAQAIYSLEFDRQTLKRLEQAQGAVSVSTVRDAERRVRETEISVDRIEKTLRSWQLTPEEVAEIVRDSTKRSNSIVDSAVDLSRSSIDTWAHVDIRSPMDATIVEKNLNVGTLVDLDDTLFKVANLRQLDIRAFAYEEDLFTLQRLPKENRKWTIRLKGDQQSDVIEGVFDRIGDIIDPVQHTGLVMGWVENATGMLRAGQFVTASVALPEATPSITFPASAIVDYDSRNFILIQSYESPAQFFPTEVKVVRYQNGLAFVSPRVISGCMTCLEKNSKVVSAGAVEILAEYRNHLNTLHTLPNAVQQSSDAAPSSKWSSPNSPNSANSADSTEMRSLNQSATPSMEELRGGSR
jgi:cobalt-zinc-cadmium efflux system membrane fusion protein